RPRDLRGLSRRLRALVAGGALHLRGRAGARRGDHDRGLRLRQARPARTTHRDGTSRIRSSPTWFALAVRRHEWRVDAHGLAVLEFPAIVERLRAATESAYGETLAVALLPSSDRREVEERQALTSEAVALLDHAAEPSFAGLADVRKAVARAARDGVLGPGELRQISLAVSVALEARRMLESAGERAPLLCERALRIEFGLAGLADSIARCVDEEGAELRDGASPQLRRLRADLRNGRQR